MVAVAEPGLLWLRFGGAAGELTVTALGLSVFLCVRRVRAKGNDDVAFADPRLCRREGEGETILNPPPLSDGEYAEEGTDKV